MHRVIVALLSFALLAGSAGAATLLVPGQYATIQAAINAAADGDVIEVSRGLYPQALTITDKTLTIRSHFPTTGDPADIDETVLEASADNVTLNGAALVTLQGLHLGEGSAAVRVNVGGQLVRRRRLAERRCRDRAARPGLHGTVGHERGGAPAGESPGLRHRPGADRRAPRSRGPAQEPRATLGD